MRKFVFALAALVGVAGTAHAADAEDTGPWSGNVAAGFVKSTGNTEDTTGNFDLDVAYTIKPWEHTLKGRAYGSSDEQGTTAESYALGWKSTYDFNEFNYTFGALDWNKDRFAGFTRQTFATVGYGRRILNNETFVLNAEVGVGYAKQKPAVGETEDGASGTLGGDFTWNFSDTASFEQTLYVFFTSDNNFWESVSKVRTTLTGALGLAVSYTVKQNSDVPPGTDKTDTLTAISLDYAF